MNDMSTKVREARLLRRETVAEGTMAFHFDKPDGFDFKPGQAIDLVLGSERHAFSLVGAPFEPDLAIATRMRDSAYKKALAALPIGAAVGIEGPFGSLTLHRDRSRAAIFIAGGIGITPFMSILRNAARDPQPRALSLVYSNRRPEDAAFLEELTVLARAHADFRLTATMTQMQGSERAWDGAAGVVDAKLLERASRGLSAPIYYLAGPPGMVAGLRATLEAFGVDEDDIRSEEFFGY